jgi:hypothetical protein
MFLFLFAKKETIPKLIDNTSLCTPEKTRILKQIILTIHLAGKKLRLLELRFTCGLPFFAVSFFSVYRNKDDRILLFRRPLFSFSGRQVHVGNK